LLSTDSPVEVARTNVAGIGPEDRIADNSGWLALL
jgi:hypothetical protein